MKEKTKKMQSISYGYAEIIYKCNNSAWKQEFLFKHYKKMVKNIRIIVNVDNDRFHVSIGK
jgi:hypothetical protein